MAAFTAEDHRLMTADTSPEPDCEDCQDLGALCAWCDLARAEPPC